MALILPDDRHRVLFLPDEGLPGDQAGPRRFWELALKDGRIGDLESFSFLHTWRSVGSLALNSLKEIVASYRPTLLFWQHISDFPVDRVLLSKLRDLSPGMKIVYYEIDMYGRWRKSPTSNMKALFQEADIVFLSGGGEWKRQVEGYGTRRVLHAPTPFDEGRFGRSCVRKGEPSYDVVMVGSLVRPRLGLPFLGIPGSRDRKRLALALYQALGARFAVYGNGWDEFPFSKGPIPYDHQQHVMQDAWLTAIWDHFPKVDDYFSDRFPISLASGVAHACNWRVGLESKAEAGAFLHAKSVDSLLQAILEALAGPRKSLIEMGISGRELAFQEFTTQKVFGDMMSLVGGSEW